MAVRRIFLADGKRRALLKKCDNYRFLHGAGPRFLLATFAAPTALSENAKSFGKM
jgi:hypothetical protein